MTTNSTNISNKTNKSPKSKIGVISFIRVIRGKGLFQYSLIKNIDKNQNKDKINNK